MNDHSIRDRSPIPGDPDHGSGAEGEASTVVRPLGAATSTDDVAAPHPRGDCASGGPGITGAEAAAARLRVDAMLADDRELALALICANPRGLVAGRIHAHAWLAVHYGRGADTRWPLFTSSTAGPVGLTLGTDVELLVDAGLVARVRSSGDERLVATAAGMQHVAAARFDRIARRALVKAAYHRDPIEAVRELSPASFVEGDHAYLAQPGHA